MIDNYSGEQWNKNLNILQSESHETLNKISQSRVKDENLISGFIGEMTKNY